MKKRFTAADMYEKKYTGKVSRYGQEAEKRVKKAESRMMLQHMFLTRVSRGRAI